MLKPQYDYYSLIDTKRYEEEVPLSELYDSNRAKIIRLRNRKPEWDEITKTYSLKFDGKIRMSSVKNFILEDEDTSQVRMIFGKLAQDEFRADLWNPLNPYIGFGIALATFGTKIGCE